MMESAEEEKKEEKAKEVNHEFAQLRDCSAALPSPAQSGKLRKLRYERNDFT